MTEKIPYKCSKCGKPTSRTVLLRFAGVCKRHHERAVKLAPPRKTA